MRRHCPTCRNASVLHNIALPARPNSVAVSVWRCAICQGVPQVSFWAHRGPGVACLRVPLILIGSCGSMAQTSGSQLYYLNSGEDLKHSVVVQACHSASLHTLGSPPPSSLCSVDRIFPLYPNSHEFTRSHTNESGAHRAHSDSAHNPGARHPAKCFRDKMSLDKPYEGGKMK